MRCVHRSIAGFALSAILLAAPALAMNVVFLSFDPNTEELTYVVLYRGTHPNHDFRVVWEPCRQMGDGRLEILGIIHDSDPRDSAQREFEKTERLSLKGFSCRPALITIGSPNPLYRRSVKVPGPLAANH